MAGKATKEEWFEAVVVGSGFGGSVTAYRLAKGGRKVCLLERGKRWPPGSFPRTPYQFSQALWDPSEGRYGLYDVWFFQHLGAIVSSGLGGGSLIYANVILEKPQEWFTELGKPWPINYDDLKPHYDAVRQMLEPVEYPEHYARKTPKTRAFYGAADAAGLKPFYPKLAITFGKPDEEPGTEFGDPEKNVHGEQRYTCRLVGECNVGCNYGSKNSLDFTYLSKAESELDIRCLHEVKSFGRCQGGFRIEVVDHSKSVEAGPNRRIPPERKMIFAERLILAAGTLGTPYLLLRNRSAFPNLPPRLGTCFTGNGDFIAFAARSRFPMDPSRGPVITAAFRVDEGNQGEGGYCIEDGGYADFLAWVGEIAALPRFAWAGRRTGLKLGWGRLRHRLDPNLSGEVAALLGAPRLAGGTLPLLGMGREPPRGRMKLRNGLLDVEWSFDEARAYLSRIRSTLRILTAGLGAEFVDNILWRLNANVTAHPLGGCPLGETWEQGVVDPETGQVHGYPGLHVADGSVMPGTVGANPSLTIAAVADRFADAILSGNAPVP